MDINNTEQNTEQNTDKNNSIQKNATLEALEKDATEDMNSSEISIDEFKKALIKIGTIISAEAVPDADRLIRFMVDLGGEEPVQILSGIREYFSDPEVLVGRQVPVVTNLPTRKIRGLESHGMIIYAVGEPGNFTTIEPRGQVSNGTAVQ